MDLINYKAQKPFAQKHLLCLQDYSRDEILQVLSQALKLKEAQKRGESLAHVCKGKVLAMVFAKSSTRTRVSFESGFYKLGGHPMFLSNSDTQLGRGEPIEDTAQVLGRMVNGIMIRTYLQSDIEALARYSGLPVINGLSDDFHPCQALADLLSYYEKFGNFKGKLAYVGDGNNVANSLLLACSKLGLDIAVASPKAYAPKPKVVEWAKQNALESGSQLIVCEDPNEAVTDATCIYTDVWASMGQEEEQKARELVFAPYQVNETLCAKASSRYIFMHCLPAHRGEEVSAAICDGSHSIIFDEAENRLHVQMAVLLFLMGNGIRL